MWKHRVRIGIKEGKRFVIDENKISEIVKNVIANMDMECKPKRKQLGVFNTMEEGIAACNKA